MEPDDLTQWFQQEVADTGEPVPWWAALGLILVAVLCVLMFVPLVAAVAS